MDVKTNGDISFWYADMGGVPGYRPPLPGNIDVDVCIVGAGYTGLWTAYYLKTAQPSLSIAVVEKEFAGFGASGRNGGWCSGGFSWSRDKYLASGTRAGVIEFERQLRGTVDEVIRVCEAEGIDADIRRTDCLTFACSAATSIEAAASNNAPSTCLPLTAKRVDSSRYANVSEGRRSWRFRGVGTVNSAGDGISFPRS